MKYATSNEKSENKGKKLSKQVFRSGKGLTEMANPLISLVPGAGIEPAWAKARWILSPVRLPVSPPRQYLARYARTWSSAELE